MMTGSYLTKTFSLVVVKTHSAMLRHDGLENSLYQLVITLDGTLIFGSSWMARHNKAVRIVPLEGSQSSRPHYFSPIVGVEDVWVLNKTKELFKLICKSNNVYQPCGMILDCHDLTLDDTIDILTVRHPYVDENDLKEMSEVRNDWLPPPPPRAEEPWGSSPCKCSNTCSKSLTRSCGTLQSAGLQLTRVFSCPMVAETAMDLVDCIKNAEHVKHLTTCLLAKKYKPWLSL